MPVTRISRQRPGFTFPQQVGLMEELFMSPTKRQFQMRTFLLALAIFGSVPRLRANVTGSILGVVKDPTAAVLPGVEVTATNLDTNRAQKTQTDATGEYRILALPVGRYKVEATLSGFQKFVATGVVLTVNEQHRVDVTIQLCNVDQTVEVKDLAKVQFNKIKTELGEMLNENTDMKIQLKGRT